VVPEPGPEVVDDVAGVVVLYPYAGTPAVAVVAERVEVFNVV
jgi:hypothetical protein